MENDGKRIREPTEPARSSMMYSNVASRRYVLSYSTLIILLMPRRIWFWSCVSLCVMVLMEHESRWSHPLDGGREWHHDHHESTTSALARDLSHDPFPLPFYISDSSLNRCNLIMNSWCMAAWSRWRLEERCLSLVIRMTYSTSSSREGSALLYHAHLE